MMPLGLYLSEALIPGPADVPQMHCSGFATEVAQETALGEVFVRAGTSRKIIINGVLADDVSNA